MMLFVVLVLVLLLNKSWLDNDSLGMDIVRF